MTNQEILEKAIKKAIDGGWIPYDNEYQVKQKPEDILIWIQDGHSYDLNEYYEFIFNHDFAKALWDKSMPRDEDFDTEEETQEAFNKWKDEPTWDSHLQQMVIADDPIKYLGENV